MEEESKNDSLGVLEWLSSSASWVIVFVGFALISSLVWNNILIPFSQPFFELPVITPIQMMAVKWFLTYLFPSK